MKFLASDSISEWHISNHWAVTTWFQTKTLALNFYNNLHEQDSPTKALSKVLSVSFRKKKINAVRILHRYYGKANKRMENLFPWCCYKLEIHISISCHIIYSCIDLIQSESSFHVPRVNKP